MLLSLTHILGAQFQAAAAARDKDPFGIKFAELCAIMGDKKAKEIVERDKWLLQRASGITSTFAELVDAMGGGEKGTHSEQRKY
jgi:hypothetical protein